MSLYSALTPDEISRALVTPEGVSELLETNDAVVLESQLSSDELVNNEDIVQTHDVILAGRQEQAEEESRGIVSFNLWDLFKKGAINMVLPFINGIMLGFGEILAHEIGFKYGFVGAKVQPPRRQKKSRYI